VETILRALGIDPAFEPAEHELLHPGKTATLGVGVLGEVRPGLLEGHWSAFELDLAALADAAPALRAYEDVITYPALRQDLAFAVDEGVAAGDLAAAAREAAGAELRSMTPFDVYRGEQVGEGRKSIAFRVEFRSPDRTLTDEEAAGLRERIVAALGERFGAELRA
jgi:phenylalanyl-tRNA synthetase beta chain